MASHEINEFDSWNRALSDGKLNPDQIADLQKMVDAGEAKDLSAAAQFLDWQQTVINPMEHMYGF